MLARPKKFRGTTMCTKPFALSLIVVALAMPALSSAVNAGAPNPVALVTELDMRLRQVHADSGLTTMERQRRFRGLLEQGFDFSTISHFVLGRYWLAASDQVRQEFSGVFVDYVVQSLDGRLGEYIRGSLNVTGTRAEGAHDTVVSTVIDYSETAPPAMVDWRVMDTPGGLKVTDVSLAGMSLALTYRDQFVSVIDHHDGQVSSLISELRGKLDTRPNAGALSNNSGR